jgi:hypothetical protein
MKREPPPLKRYTTTNVCSLCGFRRLMTFVETEQDECMGALRICKICITEIYDAAYCPEDLSGQVKSTKGGSM